MDIEPKLTLLSLSSDSKHKHVPPLGLEIYLLPSTGRILEFISIQTQNIVRCYLLFIGKE